MDRLFPSCLKPLFQSEAKCEAIATKMIFNYDANKTHFHNTDFALSLVLKVRFLELENGSFLQSLLRRHFVGKQVVASRKSAVYSG